GVVVGAGSGGGKGALVLEERALGTGAAGGGAGLSGAAARGGAPGAAARRRLTRLGRAGGVGRARRPRWGHRATDPPGTPRPPPAMLPTGKTRPGTARRRPVRPAVPGG